MYSMKDKKLTDNEIVKALASYVHSKIIQAENGVVSIGDILDLINRLQAENEGLKAEVKFSDYLEYETTNQIKAEAYKEFADRLKEKYGYYDWENKTIVYPDEEIDNLLKELVGENNAR